MKDYDAPVFKLQAKNSLESALKPRSTLSSVDKTAVLSAALDQADAVLQSKLSLATVVGPQEGNASTEEGGLAGADSEASPLSPASLPAGSGVGGSDSDAATIEEDLKAVSLLLQPYQPTPTFGIDCTLRG